MYGDDGQPVGYDGTTSATQGTAHKINLLNSNHKYVSFGVGFDSKGYIQEVIDFYDSTNSGISAYPVNPSPNKPMSYNDFVNYTSQLIAQKLVTINQAANKGVATSSLAATNSPLWLEALQNAAADIPTGQCNWTVPISGVGLLTWWDENPDDFSQGLTVQAAQNVADHFISERLTGTSSGYMKNDQLWRTNLPKSIAVGVSINLETDQTFFNIVSESGNNATSDIFYN